MADLSTRLSANFTLKELVRSSTAERDEALKLEQENVPDDVLGNLQYLTQTVLQPIRTRLDFPIRVNSGYRCPHVNKLVGGSGTSQHCVGEAADIELSSTFLTDPSAAEERQRIGEQVEELVGKPLRPEVDENFYLFAFICLNLEEFDVDQLIHEFGEDFGRPAWVHVSASRRQDKRQVLFVGRYTNKAYVPMTVEEALTRGT